MGNYLQIGKLRQRVGKGDLPNVTLGLGQKAALLSPVSHVSGCRFDLMQSETARCELAR